VSGSRKLAALLVPWVFLAVFTFMYFTFLWPRVSAGGFLPACLGAIVALVGVSFVIAAVTFSRDVLSGRYP
jgi:predicted anti-sigma-YlaC factor YlaD